MSLISKDIPFVPIGNEQVIRNKPQYGVINSENVVVALPGYAYATQEDIDKFGIEAIKKINGI